MQSTMQDGPLLISRILRHGQAFHGESRIITVRRRRLPDRDLRRGGRARRAAGQGAPAPRRRRGRPGRHLRLEQPGAPRGVPGGAVAWARCCTRSTSACSPSSSPTSSTTPRTRSSSSTPRSLPLLGQGARRAARRSSTIIVVGEGDTHRLRRDCSTTTTCSRPKSRATSGPSSTSGAPPPCVTRAGTTGNPKGVVYSHRSTWLHSLARTSATSLGVVERDRLLIVVPMFHANAWGMPYTALLVGADLILPQQLPAGRAHSSGSSTSSGRRSSLGVPTDLERRAALRRDRCRPTCRRCARCWRAARRCPER